MADISMEDIELVDKEFITDQLDADQLDLAYKVYLGKNYAQTGNGTYSNHFR